MWSYTIHSCVSHRAIKNLCYTTQRVQPKCKYDKANVILGSVTVQSDDFVLSLLDSIREHTSHVHLQSEIFRPMHPVLYVKFK